MAEVRAHLVDELPGVVIQELRHLAVEVRSDAVADVDLHQCLGVVSRQGRWTSMEVLDRVDEGPHRRHRIRTAGAQTLTRIL